MKVIVIFSFIFLLQFTDQVSAQFINNSLSPYRNNDISGAELLLQSTDYLFVDSVWQEESRITYNYMPVSLLLDSVLYEVKVSGNWENEILVKYFYQSSYQPYERLELDWNGYNWENHWKTTITYNQLYQIETALIQTYSVGEWDNADSLVYSYNSADSIENYFDFRWDAQHWDNSNWSSYSYNVGGNLEQRVMKNWSQFYSQWINLFRYTYSYNNNYQVADKIYELWVDTNWVKQTKTEFIYDTLGYGFLTERYRFNWDGDDWIESKKYIYNYYEYYPSLHELIELNRIGSEWENYKKTVYDRIIVGVEDEVKPVQDFKLLQNYPNPFNPTTKITFSLAAASDVTLKIFDVLGQEVATLINNNLEAGAHSIEFDASLLNSGVYFYRLEAKGSDGQNFVSTKKMTLLR